ncbi:MAG: hypothetical protein KJ799_05895 [Bacteroidetes bacterium]|nr:hypothetical protein [Bacteroidota bacterium]MBU1679899.1 hypothetical protein [Bacteroidota bacterium]MBU2506240.1 hypothetical protein [Bacteroidota bacterium]
MDSEKKKGIDNLIDLENEYENSTSFVLDLKLILAIIPIIIFANHSDAISSSRRAQDNMQYLPINFNNWNQCSEP